MSEVIANKFGRIFPYSERSKTFPLENLISPTRRTRKKSVKSSKKILYTYIFFLQSFEKYIQCSLPQPVYYTFSIYICTLNKFICGSKRVVSLFR